MLKISPKSEVRCSDMKKIAFIYVRESFGNKIIAFKTLQLVQSAIKQKIKL